MNQSYWKRWQEFEVTYGNEDTFREMLRIKRSVQAQFNTQVSWWALMVTCVASYVYHIHTHIEYTYAHIHTRISHVYTHTHLCTHRSTLHPHRCWQLQQMSSRHQVWFPAHSMYARLILPHTHNTLPHKHTSTYISGGNVDEMKALEERAKKIAEEAKMDQPRTSKSMMFVM